MLRSHDLHVPEGDYPKEKAADGPHVFAIIRFRPFLALKVTQNHLVDFSC